MTRAEPVEIAAGLLQGYADRGVFRGFSPGPARAGRAAYRIVWHRDRTFDFVLDTRSHTLHCPLVLPQVERASVPYRELEAFLESRRDAALPEHRRIDPARARVACALRGRGVSLSVTILDGDYEYGIRKFVHLLHEIFVAFLTEYFDYQVEAFNLDPDRT